MSNEWNRNASFFTLHALLSTWERRDDLIAVSVWLVMLSYALISNILILVGIARSSTMRSATRYKYVDMGVNSISLFMMIMSYAIIIYKVRESGKAMAKYQLTIRTRQQHALMSGMSLSCQMNGCTRMSSVRPPRSQFFVVSLVFLLTWTTWQWLPHMSGSKWAYFVMTSLFFINNSVNPTVYLLFNTQLRRELHYLLCRHHVISAVQNKRKRTLFGKAIINNTDPLLKTKKMAADDEGIQSAGDLGHSMSSHTTSEDHVRTQLLIQNTKYIDKTTISAV
uniref:G_PROTEIN_RECEP_F1_2 domain-containing protein n=1 Tax=Heterorhabditis bacteriophora TaxID=37862 RepID=A0A1I7XEE9_HETBA